MTPKHPLQVPTTQVIDVDGEQIHQFPADAPGPLAIVLTVTNVTGGQRITFREQTTTSRTDATPIAAENPLEGEAMVPEAFGTVAADRLVMTFSLPGRDELCAVPVNRILFSYVENASFNPATCQFTKTIRTVFLSGIGLKIEDA